MPRRLIISMLLICLIITASCAGTRNKDLIRSGMFQQGIHMQAFKEVWGNPDRTQLVVFKDEDETVTAGFGRLGGGLFKGKRTYNYHEWTYEKENVVLLFDRQTLVDWKANQSVKELQDIARKREKNRPSAAPEPMQITQ